MLFVTHASSTTPWQTIALRFGGSVALLALGYYAAHESTQHRNQAQVAKAKQLDLAALDPFIANLEVEEQRRIKAAAARRLFAEPDSGNALTADGVAALADALRDVLTAVEKTTK